MKTRRPAHLAVALVAAALGMLLACIGAYAEPAEGGAGDSSSRGRFAAGLAVGDPSGLSLAFRFGERFDLQGLFGWDLRSPGGPTVSVDILRRFGEFDFVSVPIRPYAGLGLKATSLAGDGRFGDSSAEYGAGLRIPLGVRLSFDPWPIEAFLELTAGVRWYPDVAFDPDAVLGARILF